MKRRKFMRNIVASFILLSFVCSMSWAQYGDRQYRRYGILSGNQVRTVFGNWGVVGQPGEQGKRGAWKDDNNGYIGDVSPLVGAEIPWHDTTFHAIICTPTARPQASPLSSDPRTGKPWAFEPLGGYFAPEPNQKTATKRDETTWPKEWPDKLNDVADPGWKGSWNGYFGKRASADEETYYVMDDQNFERFSEASNNSRGIAFKPDSRNLNRNGLGLQVSVRGLQWSQFLAQDNIFWLYEIKNTGTTTYNKMLFGMIVGTYVGVTSTENAGEYDDDWSFFDVRNNITYTGDFDRNTSRNARWNQKFPVGMVGYAFLESPGNPFDGIDNDGDADSAALGRSAPFFNPQSFSDSSVILPGQRLVLIKDDYARVVFTVPSVDSVKVKTRGMRDSIWIRPGFTKRIPEGNEVFVAGAFTINPNVFDGIDNNFNGLIDENYYLHYRQLKRNPLGGPPLIDTIRAVRRIDYAAGLGTSPLSMIDEKRDDRIDNDNNWSKKKSGEPIYDPDGNLIDDVGRDGVQNTNDTGERDGQPTSGYDASGNDTGLPGEPNIDKTDVHESDQIGLSSFFYFTPAGDLSLGNDELLWTYLSPGYFSVPTSIVNNVPQFGQDGDFTYSSGYFPLRAGETERFSIALVYGGGKRGSLASEISDLLFHKKTVQNIYDANYKFAVPPDRPTLTAVAGDKQVTLYWDRIAEASIDPILKAKDFEGYRIYKSTSLNFSDAFTITDGTGTALGYRPLKQFDLADSVQGYFRATGDLFAAANGYSIFLGEETGLQHSFVDNEVDNGRTYYYAVVAYDKGSDSLQLFPSENDFLPSEAITGQITHPINTAIVIPNAKVAGYVAPPSSVELNQTKRLGTGSARYNVVDQTKVTGHSYTVTFLDSQVDTIDNNGNGLADAADSTEWNRLTSFYSVKDNQQITETFNARDTTNVRLAKKNQVPSSVTLKNAQGAIVPPSSYALDTDLGSVRGTTPGSLPTGKYSISYQYYPVYRSSNIQGTPYQKESKDSDIFDGIQLAFNNDWGSEVDGGARLVDTISGWNNNKRISYDFERTNLFGGRLQGIRTANDYQLQMYGTIVDTSQHWPDPDFGEFLPSVPVNFRVLNLTDSTYTKFYFYDPDLDYRISTFSTIVILDRGPDGRYVPSWALFFKDTLRTYNLNAGDQLTLKTSKPFRQGDQFEFTTVLPKIEYRKNPDSTLARIRAVPNPYITAASFEHPLTTGLSRGRGERRIDFTHLPIGSSIKIFTSRGDHVISLVHDGTIEDGTASWNLKTKENLDIAYGVYFYVVETPIGTKTGKLAIIK